MEELASIEGGGRAMRPQRKYSIYKANKRGSGAAMQFDFNPNRESVFVEAAVQKSEQEFDWDNKLVLKLGANDIPKLLLVLEGKSKTVDLFHEPSKSQFAHEKTISALAVTPASEAAVAESAKSVKSVKNASFNLTRSNYGFFAKLSQQYADSSVRSVSIPISEDEAVTLRVLFSRAIEAIYKW